LSFAKEQSQDVPTAAAALRDYEAAVGSGDGDKDLSVVAERFRKK
jgi:hypothetical protein